VLSFSDRRDALTEACCHRWVLDAVGVAGAGGSSVAGPTAGVWLWKTICNQHRRWSADGTYQLIVDELRRGADVAEGGHSTPRLDGAIVHAADARHRPPVDVPLEVLPPLEVDTGGGGE
jgi:hypothetical protein